MNVTHRSMDGHGLSQAIWNQFPKDEILFLHDRSCGFGFYDDFESFQATTLEGPYLILEGSGCTCEQVADTGNTSTTALGQVRLLLDGNSANDEVVLQRGRGLSAPFKLADHDLCFEARIAVSSVAANQTWAIGLGEVSMGATDGLFADVGSSVCALANKNFFGFVHLTAETTALDAAYKADGQTYQDGATKTKLNAIHTLVAATFVQVGFRYRARDKSISFAVDGVEIPAATLTASELDAVTFPDDVFLNAIFGAKDAVGTALSMYSDWWACAQAV